MKKFTFIAGMLLCSVVLAGCVNNNEGGKLTTGKTHISLTAGIETRTAIDGAGAPSWTDGDAIGVHFVSDEISAADSHHKLAGTSADGGQTATFEGDVELAAADYTIYGYYPHGVAGDQTDHHKTAKIEIPAVQKPTATSFDPAADVMVMWPVEHNHNGADITHAGLQFKRVLATLKFIIKSSELNGEAIQNLTFTTGAGFELAGIEGDVENDFLGFDGVAETVVKAEPAEAVTTDGDGAVIMICVPVMNIPVGTELTVTGETESYTFSKTTNLGTAIVLEQGGMHIMNIENPVVEPKSTGLQTPPKAKTTTTWEIAIEGGTQIWSDAINMDDCNKTTFNPAASASDCRNHTDPANGYYYTQIYVRDNQDLMCPAPWRVPTQADFVALDKGLGGSGQNNIYATAESINAYNTTWGGKMGGYPTNYSTFMSFGTYAYYWSQTKVQGSESQTYVLMYKSESSGITTDPGSAMRDNKSGYNVRCVTTI